MVSGKAEYEVCGAPHSKDQYPQYPNCTMTPEGYTGFTCDPVCYDEWNCGDGGEPVGPDTAIGPENENAYKFGSMYSYSSCSISFLL